MTLVPPHGKCHKHTIVLVQLHALATGAVPTRLKEIVPSNRTAQYVFLYNITSGPPFPLVH